MKLEKLCKIGKKIILHNKKLLKIILYFQLINNLLIRISDSNARLGSNAINLVELISKAMGSSFKNYIKGYLPGVLNALGDPKVPH